MAKGTKVACVAIGSPWVIHGDPEQSQVLERGKGRGISRYNVAGLLSFCHLFVCLVIFRALNVPEFIL